ncbi:MAG: prefoldin subunit alpha [Candidatus Thermoplasmatota archaeon]
MAEAPGEAPRPEQLMAQFDMVQRALARVDRQLAALEQALMESQQALGTVRHLASAAGRQEMLLPIGGGVHVRATVDAGHPVLLPIGASYSTDGAPADVAAALEARLASIQQQFSAASEEASRLSQTAAALNEQLGSLSSS